MNTIRVEYDVVVVGGGMSGVCAAIASARHGVKTALLQNRPCLGGNASSEIRMHICGATKHGFKKNVRETGILDEILLENKYLNPGHSFSVFDTVLWQKVTKQEGLTLYLNTHIDEVKVEEGKIIEVSGVQQTTEKQFEFLASHYIDTTGDGLLAAKAGASFMMGRESKDTYEEDNAPDVKDACTMGNSILFTTRDMGRPVPFIKPDWARTYKASDFIHRPITEVSNGYWWIELGGNSEEVIKDGEIIRDRLLEALYGIWDHIKNSGLYEAESLTLDWIGCLPGKRESRRVLGDYVLRESDLLNNTKFKDSVAYGGWTMDMHCVDGMDNVGVEPTYHIETSPVYAIPYRSLYAKDLKNLYIGGRAISASHMAFGSTRVMATCAVVGQAVGTIAAHSVKKNENPQGMNKHIKEMQQLLLIDDCYIPGVPLDESLNLATNAEVVASSEIADAKATNTINGFARSIDDNKNKWQSNGISPTGEWVSYTFKEPMTIETISFKFDSDLTSELMPSISPAHRDKQYEFLPKELVKDYDLVCLLEGKEVYRKIVKNNRIRLNRVDFDQLSCDAVKLISYSTYGEDSINLFEMVIEGTV